MRELAIIGLGLMGGTFARHLLEGGYVVRGFDVVPSKMEELTPSGLRGARSAAEASAGAELVITSLPNHHIVEEAVLGAGGVLEGLPRGAIIADTSTVPPAWTRRMAGRVEARGVRWLDCPVSGTSAQARRKDLVVMGGGEREVFERCRPVFDTLGKRTLYVGPHGQAAQLKLIVNLVLFVNMAGAAEGLILGKKAGIDPEVLLDALCSGAGSSNVLQVRGNTMLKEDFTPAGPISTLLKDMDCILDSAKELDVPLPLTALAHQLYLV
ncbi:MAG: NAD(P)-dependent oxidoreductase, partial [Nitrospinota bacterium]